MVVRAYLGSSVAVAWTLAALVGVGAIVAAGWRVSVALVSATMLADPAFLGGAGTVAVPLFVASAVLAVAGAVWLPCSAAIAYAVGRRARGRRATFPATVAVVRGRAEPLYRWAKTLVGVGPIAERILTENDVGRAEIAVGCRGFVVPALVLDAPALAGAVERANRIVPVSGGRRLRLLGGIGTIALAAAGLAAGAVVSAAPATPALALPGLVVGGVVTAAIDAAWRAATYATADRDDGFAG